MPRKSENGNVRKRCDCLKWKTCAHPWYVDYKAAKDHPRRPNQRYRNNLDVIAGDHPVNLRGAQDEARRAIAAWLEGHNPQELLPADDPTVAQLLEKYEADCPRKDRRAAEEHGRTWQIARIVRVDVSSVTGRRRPFGEYRASDVTSEMIEEFRRQRPAVGGNRDLALLRAMFNWAVLHHYVEATPFRVGHIAAVKLAREEPRTRRLQAGEEDGLLQHAQGDIRDLIIAALETGCRSGELLSLQWQQVRFAPRAEFFLPGQKTKAKKDRRIPISSTLYAILQGRRHDPAGQILPPTAFVFGDALGRPRKEYQTAWEGACRRANITGLHFHDLRREAGSRWMDAGVPLGTIQRWLGHANIAQTSTYLGASLGNDERDMAAYEERIGRRVPDMSQGDIFFRKPSFSSASDHDDTTQNLRKNTKVH